MESIHAEGTPLGAYLEGEGYRETLLGHNDDAFASIRTEVEDDATPSFAPSCNVELSSLLRKPLPKPILDHQRPRSNISRVYDALSIAVNSRLGRTDNARFIEHFRYTIAASQLLNEYLDQGPIPATTIPNQGLDGSFESAALPSGTTSLYGAATTAIVAFALVYLIHWARTGRDGLVSKSRVAVVAFAFILVSLVGYAYIRRQWLKYLRRNAVAEVTALTTNWQAFELSASSALSTIQEVELVSKGYRLSTPLPPASRLEEHGTSRRCVRLRRLLNKTYVAVIPTCINACSSLRSLVEEDDLEKYFEVYDINTQDTKEAEASEALTSVEDDPESLKSLRILSYRAGVLRRVILCSLMALEADGGKPDFYRWRFATDVMSSVSKVVGVSAERLQYCLSEMETVATPMTPPRSNVGSLHGRDKTRSQVRKISMLSTGIKGLQAKMQILREEMNRSVEQSEDLTDLGPNLMAQYDAIGTDLKELMQAWEAGKGSLQTQMIKHEHRVSLASSVRSPVSSLGGLTAVEEDGGPADALKALTGDSMSNRSSMGTTSDEEVFEAIASPKRRSTLNREERILKMQEERERQAVLRAKRDANTSMLRELESVISLRPKKAGGPRITSM